MAIRRFSAGCQVPEEARRAQERRSAYRPRLVIAELTELQGRLYSWCPASEAGTKAVGGGT